MSYPENSIKFESLNMNDVIRIQEQLDTRRKYLEDESTRLEKIKESYSIDVPKKEYEPDYESFYKYIMDALNRCDTLSSDYVKFIASMSEEPVDYDYSEIYKCPHYGNLELYVRHRDDEYAFVCCDYCEWEVPRNYFGFYDKEAWREFHRFLTQHEYLPRTVVFPE